ncbi:MAG: MaoC family dehydratase N-terminal domain-containing protein [Propionicimonas sp.]|uniref:FAS1-like dehydratase domain-containing protein n=1 Tax=Propionicimonas sp. TaxID=1955623 RepID=UPI002B1FC7FE|nr:MaoC family dehydratase N-terminal domain-containing protein [Propionicimonas sp.]MEA4942812.1 MaoC family dehydratase N-terminal domain-containing protein [Propionicimonas sp.]MEA5054908.1 MaoC family dehydratase N-terminal domain-containing protein [Propionicimonas sp.]MEA5118445.1 MaoC family dehydratase N-terminal domain-containing protein [Propionicimonas sp.]
MPISEQHAGRCYPATAPYQVSRAKIAEFAAALGDANPGYVGEQPIAPPTFAIVLAAAAWDAYFDDPELGVALRRTVHGDQRFSWQRPLRAGDEVRATLTIEKVRRRGATAFVTISVALATTDGEQLCTSVSTLVHTDEAEAAA